MNRVFVANYAADSLSVIDGSSNAVIATIPTGRGPFGLAADPVLRRVIVVNGYDDSVWAIDAATLAVAGTATVGAVRCGRRQSPDRWNYAANYFGNTVSIIDGATFRVLATLPTGRQPSAVSVNWATSRVYVSNFSSNTVTVLDGVTNTVVETIPVGVVPDGVASDPFTGRTYVANSITNDVSVITED